MIKHIKTQKKNRFLQTLANRLSMFAFFAYILSSIFLRTYNVQLSINIQDIKREMASLDQENSVLSTDIQGLSSKERVMSIALEDGIISNQNNVVLVNSGE